MIYRQIITDIKVYDFDFSDDLLSTDTISAISVAGTAGLVEVSARRTNVGLIQYLFIDVSACTPGVLYSLACQVTGASGAQATLYKKIVVVAEPVGIAAVPATGNVSGRYSVVLAQAGTAAPTVTSTLQNSLSGTPTLARTSVGVFTVTLAGAFLENKVTGTCSVFPQLVGNESHASPPRRLSDDAIEFRIYDWGDNLVDGFGEVHLALETYT